MALANMDIPAWSSTGVLPPIPSTENGSSLVRSPYPVNLLDFVKRFSTSSERWKILDGLLRFRTALHRVGLVSGFQWLDGCFLEHVELIENRPPRDLDVVNFLDLTGKNQAELYQKHTSLFEHEQIKNKYFRCLYSPDR